MIREVVVTKTLKTEMLYCVSERPSDKIFCGMHTRPLTDKIYSYKHIVTVQTLGLDGID